MGSRMSIQGIFFDLYGTLLVYGNMKKAWSDWLSAFYHLLEKQGLIYPKNPFHRNAMAFSARRRRPAIKII